MIERLPMPEPATLFQCRFDIWIGVEHALTGEQLDGVEEVPAGTNRRIDLQPVAHAGVEVI